MLANSPLNWPECFNACRISPIPRHFQLLYSRPVKNICGFCKSSQRWPKRRPLIRAGYTRKPTGTPGAYQLIDDETGARFIVWGGIDDDNAAIPSKEVLSWKPDTAKSSRETEVFDTTGDKPTAAAGSSGNTTTRSFSRLKAHNVRALVKKSSRTEQVISNDKEEHNFKDKPRTTAKTSDSEFGSVSQKTKAVLLGLKDTNSSTRQAQEVKENLQNRLGDTILDLKGSYSRSEHIALKSRKSYVKDEEQNTVFSRVNSSLKGWNFAGSPQNSKVDLARPFKEHQRMSGNGDFFSRKSFKDLGCSDDMIQSLRAQFILRPAHIQGMAYISVFEGKTCIIADQSGSGKTLAYLVPVIQRLRKEELEGLCKSSPRSPRVIVLVPTAELASQVLSNCRSMSKIGVPFRSMVATGGFRQKTQLDNLQQNVDVLIATPGRFVYLLQEGFLQLTNLKCVVLDEVDILFGDEGFEQVLQSLINTAPVTAQYLFVTATLPVDTYNKLVEVFPDCKVIMGPGLHRTSSGLEEVLVDCSGDDSEEKTSETAFQNKKSALLQLVAETPVPKTIVFCNKIETCRKVENVLNRFDRKGSHIRVLPFHAALTQEGRLSNMEEFLNSQSKDSLFLVCTDRASRGIDFTGVDHVVLFDFPRDPSEYVRRVGRTARGAGGKGKAFVFVVGKQVSLARRIMDRNKKGQPLHSVPSAYELHQGMEGTKAVMNSLQNLFVGQTCVARHMATKGLTSTKMQFVLNYNMNKLNASLPKLLNMLQAAGDLFKKHKSSTAMVPEGNVLSKGNKNKKPGNSLSLKAKGQNLKGKGITNKKMNKKADRKEDVCFHWLPRNYEEQQAH